MLHEHDLVDKVSREAARAGDFADQYAQDKLPAPPRRIKVEAGENIRYVLPHEISLERPGEFFMRVQRPEADVYLDLGWLRRVKKPFVRPCVMMEISLSVEQLSKMDGDTLRERIVSAKEAGVDALAHNTHRLSLELRSGFGNR